MRASIITMSALAVSAMLVAPAFSNPTMTGWDIGWNDMATVSGGTITMVMSGSNNLQYVNIQRASISFSTADMFNGHLSPFSYSWGGLGNFGVFGDQGQYFFDGAIRNSWYGGPVPGLTAYDYNGSLGVPASGTFEWLVNNVQSNAVKNSHVRGTDSSFTYDETNGTFVADLTSTGIWYWYTPSTPDSPMEGWIQNWDWSWDTDNAFAAYHNRYMTGNFRLVGTFGDDNGSPTFTDAKLQYQVAAIPAPGAALLAFFGLGIVGWVKRRMA